NGPDVSAATFNSSGGIAGVAAADATGDGAPDLLLALDGSDRAPPANVVLVNALNGLFERGASFGQSATSAVRAADVNGDGYVDAVAINASGSHQLYVGDGSGGFTLEPEHVLAPSIAVGLLEDLDGDGFPDLLLGGAERQTVDFYRNDGFGRFGPGDVTAPVITLVGPEKIELEVGDQYVEPGATAVDDVEGDVSSRIAVRGSVDPAIVGTYTIVYEVADRVGNSATPVSRTVEVRAA